MHKLLLTPAGLDPAPGAVLALARRCRYGRARNAGARLAFADASTSPVPRPYPFSIALCARFGGAALEPGARWADPGVGLGRAGKCCHPTAPGRLVQLRHLANRLGDPADRIAGRPFPRCALPHRLSSRSVWATRSASLRAVTSAKSQGQTGVALCLRRLSACFR